MLSSRLGFRFSGPRQINRALETCWIPHIHLLLVKRFFIRCSTHSLSNILWPTRDRIFAHHSEDYDAQAVWSELIAYHTTSPKAVSMRGNFLDKIITAKVDPSAKQEDEILRFKSYTSGLITLTQILTLPRRKRMPIWADSLLSRKTSLLSQL